MTNGRIEESTVDCERRTLKEYHLTKSSDIAAEVFYSLKMLQLLLNSILAGSTDASDPDFEEKVIAVIDSAVRRLKIASMAMDYLPETEITGIEGE